MDAENFQRLAHQFMVNTLKVSPNERVWIEYQGPEAALLAQACAEIVKPAGATPFLIDRGSRYANDLIAATAQEGVRQHGQDLLAQMKTMNAYIRVCDFTDENALRLTDVQNAYFNLAMRPMIDWRTNHTRWLVVEMPTSAFARSCGMETEAFEKFYLDVCLLDYSRMTKAVEPLQKLMTEGKEVHIFSPAQGTDLHFSIEGIPAVPCTGVQNIPDGECYTAPVRGSVNGTIVFGPSSRDGKTFDTIRLSFKNGKVVAATAGNVEQTRQLNALLDTDEGARYVGEFALGFNPYIAEPFRNTLFDEKIRGSLHLALGKSYETAHSNYAPAFNGNKSAIHWDLIHIQRPDYGGGKIWMDGRLIRKNGLFVTPELEGLNPENLMRPAGATQGTAEKRPSP